MTAVVDWATERGIGFSHVVALGDMSDVDFGDMLDYLARDTKAHAILLYIEAVTDARKFMSAARAAARAKPVIVIKAGRFPAGAKAAASHTGALAGSDEVYDAAFRRAGVLRVFVLDELFGAAETLSKIDIPKGEALAILTNGGGAGVLATDSLIEQGGRLSELSRKTMKALDNVLPATWSHGNPVDIIGDAGAERYRQSLDILLHDEEVHAVLVLNCPTAVSPATETAQSVIDAAGPHPTIPVLTSWLGGVSVQEPRRLFARHGVPTYDTPNDAVRAFSYLVRYRHNQIALLETPSSIPEAFAPDTEKARAIVAEALEQGREMLNEVEAKEVLAAYAIPTTRQEVARTAKEVRKLAGKFGGPVVLKILSPDIIHKSDVGGVVLGLKTPEEAEAAAKDLLRRVAKARPDAAIDGIVVQEMISRPHAYELILGMKEDAQFGPVILFGQGGTAVELIADTTLGLPPLNMRLAEEMMEQTRIYRLLQGFRDRPAVDMDTVALTLIKLSQLVVDIGEIKEVDINPLLASEAGVMALDARIRVARYEGLAHRRLAIKPYPKELEEEVALPDGRKLLLRAIQAEDEPSLRAGFDKLSPEEVRLRFFVPMKTLDHLMAARLSQINYDREMALILTEPGLPGTTEIYAVARVSADPDNVRAEYAVIVRGDMTGMGLGTLLLKKVLAYAKVRGISEVYGDVLKENRRMLHLCESLGFSQAPDPADPFIVRTSIVLQ
ncbi:MAG: bifunctional acetate--CoA ligase family protein/GNAT family N-acetyltransferase [Hyphomicrobiales bacterium]|nr:bifunctional acetate--CoA ligase family protein/GNAT family N-acetyltransferase [Hyphomicrobiales bacterium]